MSIGGGCVMEWTDKAILLTVARTGKNALVLEAFTREHGRCRCHSVIDKQKMPILLPGSFLSLHYQSMGAGKPGNGELLEADGGIIAETTKDTSLIVLTCIKDLLCKLMPLDDPAPKLFDVFEALMVSMISQDGRWPAHYALWEFTLIQSLGHIQGMSECLPAYRRGDLIYLSPNSGKLYPRERVGAFLDRMLPLPGFLMGARSCNAVDVRQALQLTAVLYENFVFPDANVDDLPPTRQDLLKALRRIQSIPPAPTDNTPVVDAEARRKRLLALRPLMVSNNQHS